jgi:hypothetical protein
MPYQHIIFIIIFIYRNTIPVIIIIEVGHMQYGGRVPPQGGVKKNNTGLYKGVMIFAIIGLVMFFVVPWVTVERNYQDEERYICQDCGYSSEYESEFEDWGTSEYECPECNSNDIRVKTLSGNKYFNFNWDLSLVTGDEDEWGGDELYSSDFGGGRAESFTKDTIWLAFWGLLFALILAIIFLSMEMYRPMHYYLYHHRSLILIIFSLVLIILSMIIMTSGLRLVNWKVMEFHQEQTAQQLDYEINAHQYHFAGYLMIIFGLILLVISILTMKRNIRQIELRNRPHDPRVGDKPSDRPAKKMMTALLYLTIITIFFIPLLPYFGLSYEGEKNGSDGDVEKVEVMDFTYGNPLMLEIVSSYSPVASYDNINDDLWAISALAWMALIFIAIGFIGLAIYSMNRWRMVYISLFLVVAISLLIISILMMSYHGFMIKDIYEFGDDYSSSAEIIYTYNYIPLIMGILILIFSILFFIFVIKNSKTALMSMMGRGAYGYGYGYPPYPPPGSQPPGPPPPGSPPQQPPPPPPPPEYTPQPPQSPVYSHEPDYGPRRYYPPPSQTGPSQPPPIQPPPAPPPPIQPLEYSYDAPAQSRKPPRTGYEYSAPREYQGQVGLEKKLSHMRWSNGDLNVW